MIILSEETINLNSTKIDPNQVLTSYLTGLTTQPKK